MAGDVLVGIDVGTTVLKAAAFDAKTGRRLAQAAHRLAVATGRDGKREQSPRELEAALCATLASIRAQLGKVWSRVAGLGLAAQGGSCLIADRVTGSAHTPLMLWNDMRAMPLLPDVARMKPPNYWRRLSWCEGPAWGLARLLWLRKSRPELLQEKNIYVGAGEYLYFRLTGLWQQDAGNALQIGCYRVARRELDAGPLRLVGVPVSFVAEMRKGHETHPLSNEAARRFGLPAGIQVSGPYMDHEAGYLAAARLSEHPLQCSLGTAWVGNFILPCQAKWKSPFQLVLPAVVGDGWLVLQPLLTGNVTWDWGIEALVSARREAALRKLKAIFTDSSLPPVGLVALPWFNMPNPLWPDSLGGGTFFGIDAGTTRADMLKALALAMTFEMARVLAELRNSGLVDSAVLGGGASKAEFFRQHLAALFHPLPVLAFVEEDWVGTRGALYAFSENVARGNAVRVKTPGSRLRGEITRRYERYLELFKKLYGHVPEAEIFHFVRKSGQGD